MNQTNHHYKNGQAGSETNQGINDFIGNDTAGSDALERLAQSFEVSAHRWELVVYPSLFAFIILASYGFYLIYSLTSDVSQLTKSVDRNMTVVADNMVHISNNLDQLSLNVGRMASNMQEVTVTMQTLYPMVNNLDSMLSNMDAMNRSLNVMTVTTSQLRDDIAQMNQNVSRPISFMNGFMPW